jgi:hypothetical protein
MAPSSAAWGWLGTILARPSPSPAGLTLPPAFRSPSKARCTTCTSLSIPHLSSRSEAPRMSETATCLQIYRVAVTESYRKTGFARGVSVKTNWQSHGSLKPSLSRQKATGGSGKRSLRSLPMVFRRMGEPSAILRWAQEGRCPCRCHPHSLCHVERSEA